MAHIPPSSVTTPFNGMHTWRAFHKVARWREAAKNDRKSGLGDLSVDETRQWYFQKKFPEKTLKKKRREEALERIESATQLLNEIDALSFIQQYPLHNNIVHLLGFERDNDNIHVMLSLHDATLVEFHARHSKSPFMVDDSFLVARDIACALRAIHKMGVLHSDIQPGNIMVDVMWRDGQERCRRAVLIDFGQARSITDRTTTLDSCDPEDAGDLVFYAGMPNVVACTPQEDIVAYALVILGLLHEHFFHEFAQNECRPFSVEEYDNCMHNWMQKARPEIDRKCQRLLQQIAQRSGDVIPMFQELGECLEQCNNDPNNPVSLEFNEPNKHEWIADGWF